MPSRRSQAAPGARRRSNNTTGSAFIGKPNTTKSTIRVLGNNAPGEPAVCLICNETVKTRLDGTIGSHRVGTRMNNSYPCPGTGTKVGSSVIVTEE